MYGRANSTKRPQNSDQNVEDAVNDHDGYQDDNDQFSIFAIQLMRKNDEWTYRLLKIQGRT